MQGANLLVDAMPPSEGERFETLLSHRNLVVERIVSSARPDTRAYAQPQDEWVLLLQGEAVLRMEGESHALKSGDYLFIPAGTEHAVERTSEGAIWLAVHLHPE